MTTKPPSRPSAYAPTLPYAQSWLRVHPNDMVDFVSEANALGWAVQAVVSIPGSWALGVLLGPSPSEPDASLSAPTAHSPVVEP